MTISKRELNKIVDSVIHPLSKENKSFIIVDEVLHAVVDHNPRAAAKRLLLKAVVHCLR